LAHIYGVSKMIDAAYQGWQCLLATLRTWCHCPRRTDWLLYWRSIASPWRRSDSKAEFISFGSSCSKQDLPIRYGCRECTWVQGSLVQESSPDKTWPTSQYRSSDTCVLGQASFSQGDNLVNRINLFVKIQGIICPDTSGSWGSDSSGSLRFCAYQPTSYGFPQDCPFLRGCWRCALLRFS
jgi:hypothetical protein